MRELIERLETLVEMSVGSLSDDEKMALAIMVGYKTSHRKSFFKEKKLGEYGMENAHVVSLAKKGFVEIKKDLDGKARSVNVKRAVKRMQHVRVE